MKGGLKWALDRYVCFAYTTSLCSGGVCMSGASNWNAGQVHDYGDGTSVDDSFLFSL